MTVYSMTGFASGRAPLPQSDTGAAAELVLELRSVNSRFLDLIFHLPDELRFCEPELRRALSAQLQRGKVEVRAAVRRTAGSSLTPPSETLLAQLAQLQQRIGQTLPQVQPLTMADVLQFCSSSAPLQSEQLQPALLKLVQSVLEALLQARAREGERLTQLLLERCDGLEALAAHAVPLIPQAVAEQQQRFLSRWRDALAEAGGASVPATSAQERALAEAAAYALRVDVAEELDRLRAHLQEIRSLLTKGGRLGKRLGFVIQELHREANTLGAKSSGLALSRISVDMRVLIEQMREQVQNVE